MNAIPIRPYSGSRFTFFLPLLTAAVVGAGFIGISNYANVIEQTYGVARCEAPIIGTYQGELVEGSCSQPGLSRDPVSTSFTQLANGDIVGHYEVKEQGHSYSGNLVQHGQIKDHKATFDWTDQFGRGTLEVTFDDDYCLFTGAWRNEEGTMINEPWNGHR